MRITYHKRDLRLPDFLIVGAARSGTSSLYFYLRNHPEIFLPEFKEPHFFSFWGQSSPHPKRRPWTVEDYAELFDAAKHNKMVGEASSSYLYLYEKSIKNIKLLYDRDYRNLKPIIILRNPVDRAWSYYMLRKRGGYDKDFFSAIRELERGKEERGFHNFILSGMYYAQVKAYLNDFPSVKTLFFEDLRHDAARFLREALEFLDVKDKEYIPDSLNRTYNISGEPRHRALTPLYNILFRENPLKNVVKCLIPYELRQKVKTDIGSKVLQKRTMPLEVRQYLQDRFAPDLDCLLTLFHDAEVKAKIGRWLET